MAGRARWWALEKELSGHTAAVRCCGGLTSTSRDKTVRVWEVNTGYECTRGGHAGGARRPCDIVRVEPRRHPARLHVV